MLKCRGRADRLRRRTQRQALALAELSTLAWLSATESRCLARWPSSSTDAGSSASEVLLRWAG